MKRDGIDLMLNYVDRGPDEQYIEVLAPFFLAYASIPISTSTESQLIENKKNIKQLLMHEIAHIILRHKDKYAQNTPTSTIEAEADVFAGLFLNSSKGDFLYCEGELDKTSYSHVPEKFRKALPHLETTEETLEKSFSKNHIFVMNKGNQRVNYLGEKSEGYELFLFSITSDPHNYYPRYDELLENFEQYKGFYPALISNRNFDLANSNNQEKSLLGQYRTESMSPFTVFSQRDSRLEGDNLQLTGDTTHSSTHYIDGDQGAMERHSIHSFADPDILTLKRTDSNTLIGEINTNITIYTLPANVNLDSEKAIEEKFSPSHEYRRRIILNCSEEVFKPIDITLKDPVSFHDLNPIINDREDDLLEKLYQTQPATNSAKMFDLSQKMFNSHIYNQSTVDTCTREAGTENPAALSVFLNCLKRVEILEKINKAESERESSNQVAPSND